MVGGGEKEDGGCLRGYAVGGVCCGGALVDLLGAIWCCGVGPGRAWEGDINYLLARR